MSVRISWSVFTLLFCVCFPLLAQRPNGQQPNGQQPIGQQPVAIQPTGMAGPPSWFPLSPQDQKYLDDVLKYWEYTAGNIQRYRSKFARWEYDPKQFSRPTEFASVFSQGSIQFAAPDKGLFKVERVLNIAVQQVTAADQKTTITVPVVKDGKPQYVQQNDIFEHWVCDGKSIFQFDSINKQLIKRDLPQDMQGKQISEGPLPFLFGAKAEEIKSRYWIRVKTPPPEKDHFHLEAIPKLRKDAVEFRSITVVIDEKEFLPAALILDLRNGGITRYVFTEREINWNILLQQLNVFHQQFYAPTPPSGWKLVTEPMGEAPAPAPVGPTANRVPVSPAAPRQAQSPIGPARR